MRYPKLFRFLAWAGPVTIAAVWAIPLGIAQIGLTYPGVATWAERVFEDWWPLVTAPFFMVAMLLLGVIYITSLIFSASSLPTPDPHKLSQSEKRREVLSGLRQGIIVNASHDKKHIKSYLEGHSYYPAVRKHLSKEFMGALEGSDNHFWALGANSKLTDLEKQFLDELDRIETMWGLD